MKKIICIYVDHSSGGIKRDLFQPVLDQFDCDDQINPAGDPLPEEIHGLNQAVCQDKTILAFVHTANNGEEWIQFAQSHEDKVYLVLLSRNSEQYYGRCCDYENISCFAPVNRNNEPLMNAINKLSKELSNP